MSGCDQSHIADSDDLPLALVFEEGLPLARLLQFMVHKPVAHCNVANFNAIIRKKFVCQSCASKYFAQLRLLDVKSTAH